MVPINITVKNKLPTNGQLQYIHGAVKHSTENTVNNIAVRECGARWVLEISGGPLRRVHDCQTTVLNS